MKIKKREIIDFREFCAGGSPAYQLAKKTLKETQEKHIALNKLRRPTAYSLYINPMAFFDPTFMIIGAAVVGVALIEKKLVDNGFISIASFLSSMLKIALPGVALGSIMYLINHISWLL